MPDWRNAAAYAPLLEADRSILAWEWLRRDPAYGAAACRHVHRQWSAQAEPWGLVAFEEPHLSAPDARPVWHAVAHPAVLEALADAPDRETDLFDLERLEVISTIIQAPSGEEHLLISDGLRSVRLDILAGTLTRGPIQLRYLLSGLASAEQPLLTLRRLLALCGAGRFSRQLHAPERRARRWILALRARDALAAGARQREIAEVLLGAAARERRWRSEVPSLRSQAQRLVRLAREFAAGGYRELLC